jgi:hypothetical protein
MLTNVSLEHQLFELMNEEKHPIIQMFQMGLVLQNTSIGIKVLKVCLHINLYKKTVDNH